MVNETLKTPSGKIITFNNQQNEAIRKIRLWLPSSRKIFTLAGVGGSGKTTVIKKIIDEYWGNMVVSAPTHKAKKVIMRTTGVDGETLHGLLGLRPDVNLDEFNPNDPIFNQIAIPKMGNYGLIIIDEASMINEDLFKLINEELEFNPKTKIIFMGDPAQIPPVNEKESIVFTKLTEDYYELTQVMRQQDGNPLFEIYDKLRNNMHELKGGFERKTTLNSKGEGIVIYRNKNEFRKEIIKAFTSNEFEKDIDYTKVIAWTNNTVSESNKIIRNEIFGKNCNFIMVGDIIMGYRSIRGSSDKINLIDNSADYKIISVSTRMKNMYDIWGYDCKIKEYLWNGKFSHKNIFIVDHTNHENLHNYAEIHDGLILIAKDNKKQWKNYYDFRKKSLIMVDITKFRNGDERSSDQKINKDIDYGLAITCHKAQGSTYNQVFIIEKDINLNRKIKERNQIKYVALSRPTTRATLLTTVI